MHFLDNNNHEIPFDGIRFYGGDPCYFALYSFHDNRKTFLCRFLNNDETDCGSKTGFLCCDSGSKVPCLVLVPRITNLAVCDKLIFSFQHTIENIAKGGAPIGRIAE